MRIHRLLTRANFVGAATMGLSCFQFVCHNPNNSNDKDGKANVPPLTQSYHAPPPGVTAEEYHSNPTPFGKILNGELPSRIYRESRTLLSFRDRSPRAPLHALVIPKRHVPSVYSLSPEDLPLLEDMRRMGTDLMKEREPRAYAEDDYICCFHVPPFNSVDHLHLHVLAPASEMNWLMRYGKYACGTRWCISDVEVMERLKGGMAAVPYKEIFSRGWMF